MDNAISRVAFATENGLTQHFMVGSLYIFSNYWYELHVFDTMPITNINRIIFTINVLTGFQATNAKNVRAIWYDIFAIKLFTKYK